MRSHSSTSSRKRQRSSLFNRRTAIIGVVLLWIVMLVAFVVRLSTRADVPAASAADPANAEQVALGRSLYTTRCASCHGANLEGGEVGTALDASGIAWQHSDAWIFTTIKQGGQANAAPGTVSLMPPFEGSLSDEQIWAVISYIKSVWPPDIQAQQPGAE